MAAQNQRTRAASDAAERMARTLVETESFKYSDTPVFPLASGALSNSYIDCRTALSYPSARELIGSLILERVDDIVDSLDAVGGLVIGAYPIAIALSDAAYRRSRNRELRAFVVRKEPKGHGLKKLIEGRVGPGDRVLIVDDVVTSGGSTIEAITKCRAEGLEVARAVVLVDRQEQDGRQKIEREGVALESLCLMSDLKEAYRVLRGSGT
jgi:orotate phosphoribosyltransferase